MAALISVIGGIGFFLLGMNLMADGLKAIAGDSLRKLLNRFTGGTVSSIITGTVITFLVQSSTATSLMTIGFVSAGMLTFVQATGVIFGSNLGTTSTGWIVAAIGLKYSISQLALPIIGVGVLMKQFTSGRWAHLGMVFSGLGLIFVGIQFLQDGMAGLDRYIDFTMFSEMTVGNILLLICIGIFMTIIMQASSAAIATTITVLSSGVIGLEQAIALVIGQNIGTTATVAFASIGASVSAKRTALSHILFNIFTGGIIFLMFPWVISALEWFADMLHWNSAELVVALFHTSFSLLGILILAPFINPFTQFIMWILPEKKSPITQHLDSSVVQLPAVATETAMRALKEAAKQILTATAGKLKVLSAGQSSSHPEVAKWDRELQSIQTEMEEIRRFVASIHVDSEASSARFSSLLHALDHIGRMHRLVSQNLNEVKLTNPVNDQYPVVIQLKELINETIEALQSNQLASVAEQLSEFSQELARFRKKERAGLFEVTAKGDVHINEAFQLVQLILLVDGITYHLWRMAHHMSEERE